MKDSILKLTAILFTLLCVSFANAQEIHFKAFKSSTGTVAKNLPDVYAWGPWNLSSTPIVIDLTKGTVKVDGELYEIIERAKTWTVKRDFKFVSFGCTTPNYDKVNVKLYQYDRGEFRIYVNGEKSAIRYVVQYLDK